MFVHYKQLCAPREREGERERERGIERDLYQCEGIYAPQSTVSSGAAERTKREVEFIAANSNEFNKGGN